MTRIFLSFLMIALSLEVMAEAKMSLRDKKYKEEHLKKMGRRKGYQGNKDWANFVKMAIKYKDKDIINKMLSIEPGSMTERSEYIRDLFKIHKEDPEFFIQTSYAFFKKNMDCVARIFRYNPPVLESGEIEGAYNKIKGPSKILVKYINTDKKTNYEKEGLKDATKTYVKCQKIKEEWAKKL